MEVDLNIFRAKLRELLSERVEQLFDFRLQLMERDVADGWRAFYAQKLHFMRHLPAPLINDLGRRYETECLRKKIWRKPDQIESPYRSLFPEHFFTHSGLRSQYRNFLSPGVLDTSGAPESAPWDLIANTVMKERIESVHEHWFYKTRADATEWYLEVCERGTLTSPQLVWRPDPEEPVRTFGVALAEDGKYWSAVHPDRRRIVMDVGAYAALARPGCHLELMSKLAPDFCYASGISGARRLVFVQQGDGDLAWALMIEKPHGDHEYRYPPKLVLIPRHQKKKLKDTYIIFQNPIDGSGYRSIYSPRCIETQLLFHLPRNRRLIDFYQTFIEESMRCSG